MWEKICCAARTPRISSYRAIIEFQKVHSRRKRSRYCVNTQRLAHETGWAFGPFAAPWPHVGPFSYFDLPAWTDGQFWTADWEAPLDSLLENFPNQVSNPSEVSPG